ncbi:MAG TPA: respiratory nitrate reductase subunit gamma [Anaerolineales bacterium]
MDWNTLLFMIFPYIAITLAISVTAYRSFYRPFTISSLSSQLLERKKLFWGSISFHWGIIIILAGHLLAVLFPKSLLLWNSVPLRLYLLEITGLALGLWALGGLVVLIWRRVSEARIRAVSTWMDFVALALLLVSVITGVITASAYRFGSYWFAGVFTPYLASIFTLQPQPALVAPLPWVIKLHALNFFVLLAVFPFSRLVHIITYPLGYLIRPWQIVVRNRKVSAPGIETIRETYP